MKINGKKVNKKMERAMTRKTEVREGFGAPVCPTCGGASTLVCPDCGKATERVSDITFTCTPCKLLFLFGKEGKMEVWGFDTQRHIEEVKEELLKMQRQLECEAYVCL